MVNFMTFNYHYIKNIFPHNSMLTLFLIISLHRLLYLKTLNFDVFNPSFINLEVTV